MTHDSLRYINILTYLLTCILLTYLLTNQEPDVSASQEKSKRVWFISHIFLSSYTACCFRHLNEVKKILKSSDHNDFETTRTGQPCIYISIDDTCLQCINISPAHSVYGFTSEKSVKYKAIQEAESTINHTA